MQISWNYCILTSCAHIGTIPGPITLACPSINLKANTTSHVVNTNIFIGRNSILSKWASNCFIGRIIEWWTPHYVQYEQPWSRKNIMHGRNTNHFAMAMDNLRFIFWLVISGLVQVLEICWSTSTSTLFVRSTLVKFKYL